MKVYRQGDLCFVPVEDEKLTEDFLRRTGIRKTSRVVRRGENGGVHMLEKTEKDSCLVEYNGTLYVISMAGVKVVHREHKPVTLPKGVLEVRKQRESRENRVRQVWD